MFKKIVQLLKSSLLFWRNLISEVNKKEFIRKNQKEFKNYIKSSLLFWKNLISEINKREFIRKNQNKFKNQIIASLASVIAIFVICKAVNPAMKGVCRIILQSDEAEQSSKMRGMIIGIEARRAIRGTTLREVKSIGTLKANAEVVIKAEIPGKIAEILFTEGGEVQEGDELIKFESDLYRSECEKNKAVFTLRKAEFERVEKLYKQKVGSQKNYDEALAQVNEARAQLDSSTFQLSKTVIKAPFSGTIGIMKGSVSPGNIVQQHAELVDIVDNSFVRVEFSVPVKYIGDIAVGQSVEITVDAFKDRVFSGSVDAIDSEVDSRNHSILVRAVIPNKNGNLKHGMFANVKLVTGEKTDVVLVDEDALDREGAIEFVWIVDERGQAYRRRVLTGAKDVNGVEILSGLKDGDIVVVSGQLKLTDGSKTKILNKDINGERTEDLEEEAEDAQSERSSEPDEDDKDKKSSNSEFSDGQFVDENNKKNELNEEHNAKDDKAKDNENASGDKGNEEITEKEGNEESKKENTNDDATTSESTNEQTAKEEDRKNDISSSEDDGKSETIGKEERSETTSGTEAHESSDEQSAEKDELNSKHDVENDKNSTSQSETGDSVDENDKKEMTEEKSENDEKASGSPDEQSSEEKSEEGESSKESDTKNNNEDSSFTAEDKKSSESTEESEKKEEANNDAETTEFENKVNENSLFSKIKSFFAKVVGSTDKTEENAE
jgi:membrane fusion protein (multidrug efflux system)